jgi:hypothetical protein
MKNLLDLRPAQWNLIISPSPKQLLIAIAFLAHTAELTVLDCGRRFDSSIVARAARGRREIIDRVKIQRAFTCFEAAKLIEHLPSGEKPILILDILSTFYDENVKARSRKFLLESSIRHFQRLSRGAGLAVSVYPPPNSPDSIYLFQRLQSTAPSVSDYTIPEKESMQLELL